MKQTKSLKNLSIDGNNIYSYGTLVATKVGNDLIVPKYWSVTTSRQIGHVAQVNDLNIVKQY